MQGAFDFGPDFAPPSLTEGLFFAVFLAAGAYARVARLTDQFVRDYRLSGQRHKPERLHLSLHSLGVFPWLPAEGIHLARLIGNAVSMGPFEVTLPLIRSFEGASPTEGRSRRRPLVLLGERGALIELHEKLGAAMKRYGLRATKHFTPHMTLLYDTKVVPLQPIEPIRFVVNEFALIHSERGRTRYNVIDRWPLED